MGAHRDISARREAEHCKHAVGVRAHKLGDRKGSVHTCRHGLLA